MFTTINIDIICYQIRLSDNQETSITKHRSNDNYDVLMDADDPRCCRRQI